ncbi:BtrH N-terminal domain-containing protein [Geoalkalibacter halelectricus]|uniref:BtrH N-terminal domain-containing protein n=1 Tax=Geoalkalibacter halelectricus TaxID=2847045 RepID=A0ABY5ZPL5_9BACT|nr:BtrH N-terminal domain-containing protein [Geoalkalibacter halelectricus]MDO3379832.1 BtrH N-terminal domain-containing protein [Geoalkalibacter halelectricus]UWZ80636.1 BtrH N-terminal domain-containing protein [Geoalkalibacter halelectricus]
MDINFAHRQSAHCESGVTANLLFHHGIEISEAMAFGIGSGLFFGYLPFVKINRLPLVTFRCTPGAIFKRVAQRLGVEVARQKFRRPEQAMDALDQVLEKQIPVGLQTGVFWLPYFPPALRFHFNAHNLIVYGRTDQDYRISDPVIDKAVLCSRSDLMRARFAEGALAPKGAMYFLKNVPPQVDLRPAVISGIQEVGRRMVKAPVPIIGVRGIRFLAGRLEQWPEKLGAKRAGQYLGHLIRMQEEIGTGGGGFRFIYAAFLQEAANLLDKPRLHEYSAELTQIGDRWREFAQLGARRCKGRGEAETSWPRLADILRECADREEKLFRGLLREW